MTQFLLTKYPHLVDHLRQYGTVTIYEPDVKLSFKMVLENNVITTMIKGSK